MIIAKSRTVLGAVFLLLAALAFGHLAVAADKKPPALAPEVEAFIAEMAQKHEFDAKALNRLFGQVRARPAVLKAMATPGTARPWYEFRKRYIEPGRIDTGVAFWRENAATLERAAREYGIPEEILVATIGVETYYGRHAGAFKVLDSLVMIAFHYPPRAELFRSELEQFLLLARETGLDPAAVRGSYAGAMGIPQFLPSSYRRHAVDFDGDGKRDIIRSTADAIGSVANYYKAFGWRTGQAVVVPADANKSGLDALLEAGIKPQLKVSELKARGVVPSIPVDEAAEAALFMVETEAGPRYWLGLNNFYVITRYNRSVNYAMTVYELAQELRTRYAQQ
ncbi:MAG TPA: lytic murein transglycosylase B [Burkholderiales bacterium]|nr:lytic murein transglycosylase B [Burkholderiales bacterium]